MAAISSVDDDFNSFGTYYGTNEWTCMHDASSINQSKTLPFDLGESICALKYIFFKITIFIEFFFNYYIYIHEGLNFNESLNT